MEEVVVSLLKIQVLPVVEDEIESLGEGRILSVVESIVSLAELWMLSDV